MPQQRGSLGLLPGRVSDGKVGDNILGQTRAVFGCSGICGASPTKQSRRRVAIAAKNLFVQGCYRISLELGSWLILGLSRMGAQKGQGAWWCQGWGELSWGCSHLQSPRLLKSSAPRAAQAPLPCTPAHPRAVSSLHKVAATPEISRGKLGNRRRRGMGKHSPSKVYF